MNEQTPQQIPVSLIERHGISPITFGFITLFIIFFLYQIVGGLFVYFTIGMKFEKENVSVLRITTGVGQILFILIPTIILTKLATTSPVQYLRLHRTNFSLLILPLFGIFSLQQLLQSYILLQEKIPLPNWLRELIEQIKQMIEESYKLLVSSESLPEFFAVLIIVAIIPAFVEELLFRGLIQSSFERKLTPIKSLILTGIIFGAFHLNPFTFVALAGIGIYLGFLRYIANSLWVAVAAHFYNNALICIAIFFKMEDDKMILGNPETTPLALTIAILVGMLLIFIFSTYLFIQIAKNQKVSTDLKGNQ